MSETLYHDLPHDGATELGRKPFSARMFLFNFFMRIRIEDKLHSLGSVYSEFQVGHSLKRLIILADQFNWIQNRHH